MTAQGTAVSMDAIELLTSQHREVEQLWSQLQAAHAGQGTTQTEIGQGIVTKLSQHDALETQLLYPELRSIGGDEGSRLSDESLEDHQRIRELLSQVDEQDFADESVFAAISECLAIVTEHVGEEEGEIFPLLRSECSTERLVELGERMSDMQSKAPTHPHAHMPDSKLGATVAGAVAGVADKARDAMKDRDDKRTR